MLDYIASKSRRKQFWMGIGIGLVPYVFLFPALIIPLPLYDPSIIPMLEVIDNILLCIGLPLVVAGFIAGLLFWVLYSKYCFGAGILVASIIGILISCILFIMGIPII